MARPPIISIIGSLTARTWPIDCHSYFLEKEYNDSPNEGHSRIERTIKRIKQLFWWEIMRKMMKLCTSVHDLPNDETTNFQTIRPPYALTHTRGSLARFIN